DIECFEKSENLDEVVASAVFVPDRDDEILDLEHHACLKYVFQELVVCDGPAGFDLNHNLAIGTNGVGIEIFVDFVVESEQHRNPDFLILRFSALDLESESFQARTEFCQNFVAR